MKDFIKKLEEHGFKYKSYNNDDITIVNGDCLKVMELMEDNSVDLVLTDPPYGMDYERHIKEKKFSKIENDKNVDWLDSFFLRLKYKLKNNTQIYSFCSWHKIDLFKTIMSNFFHFKNILIWDKRSQGMGDLRTDYGCSYELICFCTNTKDDMKSLNGSRDSNIIRMFNDKNEFHPTQKPIKLIDYLIEKSSNENDLIFDGFLGSGTTALACLKTNRCCIGVELDEDYFNIACKRIEKQLQSPTLFGGF